MKPKFMRADAPAIRFNRKGHEGRVIYPTDEKFVEAQGYLAAAVLAELDLQVYALTLILNHEHGALGHPPCDARPEVVARYSVFYERFHHLIFRLLRKKGWAHGPVYTPLERTYDRAVLDVDEIVRGVIYVMGQPVKDGLYRQAEHFPGVVLLPRHVTEPRVFKRNSLIDLIDPDRTMFPEDELAIQLEIPAPLRHLGRQRYRELLEEKLAAYEAEKVKKGSNRRKGDRACRRAPLGFQFAKYRNQQHRRGKLPPPSDPGPPPPYASDAALVQAYLAERREFWDRHAQALALIRSGATDVVFPAGTYGRARDLNVAISPGEPPCWANQQVWWPD